MNLIKSTSCLAANESYYSTPFVDGVKLIVTKQTSTGKILSHWYMRTDGKMSKIKIELNSHSFCKDKSKHRHLTKRTATHIKNVQKNNRNK